MQNLFLSFLVLLFLGNAAPAFATEAESDTLVDGGHIVVQAPPKAPGTAPDSDEAADWHNQVVTSIQSCYSQLDPAEALEIQRNYLKPYQECQQRLAVKLREQKANKDKEIAPKPAPAAETPRNYLRIQPAGVTNK